MANFAVAASQETIEQANEIMEMYAQQGDKKEDTLLRILSIAKSEAVKGTHPTLEPSLRSIDSTIETLIKQINGIVAGQDSQLLELKERLDKALEEKRSAIEAANAKMEIASKKADDADIAMKQADEKVAATIAQAKVEIESAQKEASLEIERANNERDQAIRERDDARTIATEKSSSNDLLMRQMAAMEKDAQAYKELQEKHAKLSDDLSLAQNQLADKDRELETQKKEAETALKNLETDFDRRMETAKVESELAIEKAVIAKERELREDYQTQLRQADKENAKLTAVIEQLQVEIEQLKKDQTSVSDKPSVSK